MQTQNHEPSDHQPRQGKSLELHYPHEDWTLVLEEEDKTHRATLDSIVEPVFEPIVAAISRAAFRFYDEYEQPAASAGKVTPVEQIEHEIQARLPQAEPLCVAIAGRSGSGKTTIVSDLLAGLRSQHISVTALSTDNYNRGKLALMRLAGTNTWDNWDSSIVYDTAAMAQDVQALRAGQAILERRYNFAAGEPEPNWRLKWVFPAQVILVEGIMANSLNLADVIDMHYEMSTPLATCIGRRVLRDLRSDRGMTMGGSSRNILRYQLEVAEPEYRRRL